MWSKSDLAWLASNYPSLKKQEDGAFEGPLVFRMLFLDGNRYINPSPDLVAEGRGSFISAMYHVRIEPSSRRNFPRTLETAGKIQAVATAKGLAMVDLHTIPNDNHSLCLASPMAIQAAVNKGFSLKDYVEDFLIPYFFAQEYFAKNDTWPWGDLSHGIFGHLEWLGRLEHSTVGDVSSTLKNIKPHLKDEHFEIPFAVRPRMHYECLCGSKKKFRDCHPDVKRGITEVRKMIYSKKINLSDYN